MIGLLLAVALAVSGVSAQRKQEDLSFGDWLLQNIIAVLGCTVLVLLFLWYICSIHAGHAEKRAQELRSKNRSE